MSSQDTEVVLSITPSKPRRALGVISLAGLGVLMAPLIFRAEGLWSLMFVALTLAAFLGAERLWRLTNDSIVLTRTELKTGSGRVLTRVDNVETVEKGAFAFKPSNGFRVQLKQPCGKGWAPGLFWQFGRRLGIGGVIPGGQARAMAELLLALANGSFDKLMK